VEQSIKPQFLRRPSTPTNYPINSKNQLSHLRNPVKETTKKERKKQRWWVPESGDGREVTGGGHNAEREDCESELREAEGEATGRAGHALDVLHPPSGPRAIGRVGRRWSLHWVHRWVDHVHRFFFSLFFKKKIIIIYILYQQNKKHSSSTILDDQIYSFQLLLRFYSQ